MIKVSDPYHFEGGLLGLSRLGGEINIRGGLRKKRSFRGNKVSFNGRGGGCFFGMVLQPMTAKEPTAERGEGVLRPLNN